VPNQLVKKKSSENMNSIKRYEVKTVRYSTALFVERWRSYKARSSYMRGQTSG
jgi:hypothetical protein